MACVTVRDDLATYSAARAPSLLVEADVLVAAPLEQETPGGYVKLLYHPVVVGGRLGHPGNRLSPVVRP